MLAVNQDKQILYLNVVSLTVNLLVEKLDIQIRFYVLFFLM